MIEFRDSVDEDRRGGTSAVVSTASGFSCELTDRSSKLLAEMEESVLKTASDGLCSFGVCG